MSKRSLEWRYPAKLEPLVHPARYKGAHGGRGGGKSHFFGEKLVLKAFARPIRWACLREVQNTIKDSVRQLLVDKIQKFGLGRHFDVMDNEIRGENGSLIIFKGLQSYNAENIKSLEGFDGAWVEEAQTLSEKSLRLLRPTIRKPGSEIWFGWNRRHETDAVEQFFASGPPDSVCVEINWQDNPWFPDVLKQEMEHDYAVDAEMAEHVWGGGYELISERSYYARYIKTAEDNGQVGDFPYQPGLPVDTSWDIGVDDYTAIWFWQTVDGRPRVIDFWEAQGDGAPQIMAEALPEYTTDMGARYAALSSLGRPQSYVYRTHHFPHDVKVREWGGGAKERTQVLMELGMPMPSINVGVAADPSDRVQAVRSLLPHVDFNASPRVLQGITRLRRYSRKWNEALGTYTGPLKDGNDHGADAFGEYAVNNPIAWAPEPEKKVQPRPEELGKVLLPGPPVTKKSFGRRVAVG